jgi:hypothetical protein
MGGDFNFSISCDDCGCDITDDDIYCACCAKKEDKQFEDNEVFLKMVKAIENKPIEEIERFFSLNMTEAIFLRDNMLDSIK